MNAFWETGILLKLLLALVLIAVLGITPRIKAVDQEFEKARISQDAGATAHAYQHLEKAGQFHFRRADLWEQAGLLALSSGEFHKAAELLARAQSLGGLSPDGHLALGDAFYSSGNTPAALTAWQQAPKSIQLYERLADIHRSQGDYASLADDYLALLSLNPSDAHSYYQLGLLYAATRPESASAYLEQAAAFNPDYKVASRKIQQAIRTAGLMEEPAYNFLVVGRHLAVLGEWQLAAEAFYQAILARPDYAEAWAFLGEARQHLSGTVFGSTKDPNQIDPSLHDLQTALELNPQSVLANMLMSVYLQRQGNLAGGLEYLLIASQYEPDNPVLQTQLGNCTAAMGDLIKAQEYYQRAVELAPDEPTYWRILAEFSIQHEVQIRDLGLPAARQAVILSPDDPLALDVLGQALYFLEDFDNAERFFKKALDENPEYAAAHLHLGMNYLMKADAQNANLHLIQASYLAPEGPLYEHAKRLLQRYFP